MSQATAIVTGAAGHIGSHLAEELLKKSFVVLGIDNFSTGLKSNIDILKTYPNFIFLEKDISKDWDWKDSLDADFWRALKYIFHFASPASPKYFSSMNLEIISANTRGLENCLISAGKSARVVFASTSEVYGNPQVHPQPESYWGNVNSYGPRSCYNESKRLGESLIYAFNERHGTKHGLVRIFNAYGPRMHPQDGRVINEMLKEALSNRQIFVHGSGEQKRSFCYVEDLVSGIMHYAESDICRPVNIGSSEEISILDLAKKISRLFLDSPIEIRFGPSNLEDPQVRKPDLSLAQNLFPQWTAKVALDEGVARTLNWLKEYSLKAGG